MRILRKPIQIVRDNKRAYLILNAVIYGLVVIGFGLALLFPGLRTAQAEGLEASGTAELVTSLITTPWLFALVILGVNVFRLSGLVIVLPSLIVPFLGLPLFAYWAFTTGMVLVPVNSAGWIALIPHSLTVVIELQAYILFALGAYRLGLSWIRPRSIGAVNRRQGYLRGLQHLGWLAIPALALLVIGAVWEAWSLFWVFSSLAAA